MGYINDFGKTIGPLKIQTVWLENVTKTIVNKDTLKAEDRNYLALSYIRDIKTDNDLAPLLVRTPIIGSYQKNGKNYPYDSPKAVATIEWVMAYASLSPGSMPFDVSNFASTKELEEVKNQTNKLQENITINTQNINENKNNIYSNRNAIEENKKNITTNTNTIAINDKKFIDYVSDPFPDGLLLLCGDANADAR